MGKMYKYCVVCGKEYGPAWNEKCCTPSSLIVIKHRGMFKKRIEYFSLDGKPLTEDALAEMRNLETVRVEQEKSKRQIKSSNPSEPSNLSRTSVQMTTGNRQAPPTENTLAESGVDLLTDLCLREDTWTLGDQPLQAAASKLRSERDGAASAATLLRELLECRTRAITKALWVASRLTPSAELINVVQDILAADGHGPAPRNARFKPGIYGGGKVGWGDPIRVHDLAREALRNWRVAPRKDPDEEKKRAVETAVSQAAARALGSAKVGHSNEQELMDLIKGLALGKVDDYRSKGKAREMGEAAIPVIKSLLEQDLHGSLGRAAIIALEYVKSPLVFPVVELAFTSNYPAVRSYATTVLFTQARSGMDVKPQIQSLAARLALRETDQQTKGWLRYLSTCTDPSWK